MHVDRPAIFLDRDGTINVEKHYLHRVEDWEWIPGSVKAIREFNKAGYLVVVISNQAGIARGLFSEDAVLRLHNHVNMMLAKHGARIDSYFFCPHHPEYGNTRQCLCRKPLPGLIHEAQMALGIDLKKSWMIGDKLSDIRAGWASGVRGIMVATGYGKTEAVKLEQNVPYVKNLRAACDLVLSGATALFANEE